MTEQLNAEASQSATDDLGRITGRLKPPAAESRHRRQSIIGPLTKIADPGSEPTTGPAPVPPALVIPRLEPDALRALAQLLRNAGYDAAQDLRRDGGPAALDDSEPLLKTLRKLFWHWDVVGPQEAASALAPLTVEALIEAGLLQLETAGVRALFQVQVYDGLFFVVDYPPRHEPADLVLPIGPSGIYLALFTIRRQVESALDLGCGCGIQSLLIARHAGRVTATDINPRALGLTRLNAMLNDVTNIDTLEGSYFEPVADRKYDLIVANLPYVITPENRLIYRDLGASDDLPIRRNVEEMIEHLNEGGYGQLMLNWIHAADQPWHEPVAAWTAGRKVDAWMMYSHSKTSEEYTSQWMTIKEKDDPARYARVHAEWLQWYEANRIERLAFGVLTLRRRTASNNWRCSLHAERTAAEPLGGDLERLFAQQDYLTGVASPVDLLPRRLKPYAMTIERSEWGGFAVRTTRAFLLRTTIEPLTARTITQMDGRRELQACIRRAMGLRLRGRRAAAEWVAREILQLMNLGMIVPAG